MANHEHGTSLGATTALTNSHYNTTASARSSTVRQQAVNLPGLLGAMKRRHQGERSALRARQNVERRALQRRVKAGRR